MSAPEPRRVLLANVTMSARSGTDLYTRDLALSLLRRGWLPIVYTSQLGRPAEELRQATIPVVDDIRAVAARPDVIHGHHGLETLTALARFRDVPALFVCHDWVSWHSVPPRSTRIGAYVAVDRNCRDRMMFEHGIAESSIHVFTNAVDLARFRRRDALPSTPRRALIFNNAALETGYVAAIRAACARRNIDVDVLGDLSGRGTWNPEVVLPQYDLVFARARCALEAAAVGTAVVLCDARGLGGMLTTASLDAMRALNFGARTLQIEVTEENIGREIDRYDAADAAAVSDRVRASASLDVLTDQYISLYEQLLDNARPSLSPQEELDEMSAALSAITRRLPVRTPVPRGRLAILNSRMLRHPVRAMRWLKRRFDL